MKRTILKKNVAVGKCMSNTKPERETPEKIIVIILT